MADKIRQRALSPGHPLSRKRVLRIPSSTQNNHNDKIKLYNKIVRIATWDVRSVYMAEKLANVEKEMSEINSRMQLDTEAIWGQMKDVIIKIQKQEVGFKEKEGMDNG